jgi:class 3 adenylate cyclase
MGFGLHAGWAIEGAVGSLQKVDATYLSPHVNMAARLETSSKQYGVPLLASQVTFCASFVLIVVFFCRGDIVITVVAKCPNTCLHY